MTLERFRRNIFRLLVWILLLAATTIRLQYTDTALGINLIFIWWFFSCLGACITLASIADDYRKLPTGVHIPLETIDNDGYLYEYVDRNAGTGGGMTDTHIRLRRVEKFENGKGNKKKDPFDRWYTTTHPIRLDDISPGATFVFGGSVEHVPAKIRETGSYRTMTLSTHGNGTLLAWRVRESAESETPLLHDDARV